MIQFHQAKQAEVTVAALPVPLHAATGFDIIEAKGNGRVTGFEENPSIRSRYLVILSMRTPQWGTISLTPNC